MCTARNHPAMLVNYIEASIEKALCAQKAKNCTATYKERGTQSESKTSRVRLQLMASLIGDL